MVQSQIDVLAIKLKKAWWGRDGDELPWSSVHEARKARWRRVARTAIAELTALKLPRVHARERGPGTPKSCSRPRVLVRSR